MTSCVVPGGDRSAEDISLSALARIHRGRESNAADLAGDRPCRGLVVVDREGVVIWAEQLTITDIEGAGLLADRAGSAARLTLGVNQRFWSLAADAGGGRMLAIVNVPGFGGVKLLWLPQHPDRLILVFTHLEGPDAIDPLWWTILNGCGLQTVRGGPTTP